MLKNYKNRLTGAQASLLAMSVCFKHEKASIISEL